MFPSISGRSLSGHNIVLPDVHRDHVTLVLISMRAIGMVMMTSHDICSHDDHMICSRKCVKSTEDHFRTHFKMSM